MKRLIFLFLAVSLLFVSCRAKRNVTAERGSFGAAGTLEFRRLDSLWNSFSETATLHIEFYPEPGITGADTQEADTVAASQAADAGPASAHRAVKSVDVTFSKEVTSLAATAVDSVVNDVVCYDAERSVEEKVSAGGGIAPIFVLSCVMLVFLFLSKITQK